MADKVQVCVFDMSRGQIEGQELDKILFFSPANCPLPSQLSVVGLSEGLITFTRIFSPLSPCELMEAERHTHVFHQCEPDLWIVMVVEKSKETEEALREGALRAVLKDAHNLFVLFYGSLRALLQSHPRGDVARSCLHAFFPDYLSDFMTGKKFRIPSISESLTHRGTVQLFSPQRETLLEAQSLQELLKSWSGGGMVRHVMILFHNILLSSTLSPADTTTLFLYATLRMMPSSLSQAPRSRSSSRRENPAAGPAGLLASNLNNALGPSRLRNLFTNLTTSPSSDVVPNPHISDAHDSSVDDQGTRSSVPRPLVHEGWWRDADNFLCTDAWGSETGRSKMLPNVTLRQSEERLNLCVYQFRSLTLVMLVPKSGGSDLIPNLQGQLLEKAAHKIQKLEEKVVKEWPGSNAWHVAGYRYLYNDSNNKVSRFSPASKVATLSLESLAALNRIRQEIDLETGRSERSSSMEDRELELCVRTKQNAWVIVRTRGGLELYTVLEKASNTLLLACDAVEKLSKRYFNGSFSSD
ncbi:hypothetical protein MPTK1_6g12850 [Marchantia polymorpha subsp. ruderalis]|uniref:CCZ1/INTU/HSP4 first Longin domain-containing protein n=2 Tax=Marchantia polymorpha TaxID=3197 RepID=A0AAF6BRF4_MARPO|nr:hypothetical protein MARPO_0059s0063 [Marchantia polymorpha]BBN14588.1 hypothetical protein Mp_6g12850 [Marchantia polymorpha subsp. ruderalis]|eukprot:PTQ37133.1 hypothetical protein MARPO_0059s0063 [Marchantia polymorpha]